MCGCEVGDGVTLEDMVGNEFKCDGGFAETATTGEDFEACWVVYDLLLGVE